MSKFAPILLLSCLALNTLAAPVKYEFSGKISSMYLQNPFTEYQQEVTTRSVFGYDIEVDDTFSGSFIYDASTPVDFPQVSIVPRFTDAVRNIEYTVGDFQYKDDELIIGRDHIFFNRDYYKDTMVLRSAPSDTPYLSSGLYFTYTDKSYADNRILPEVLNFEDLRESNSFISYLETETENLYLTLLCEVSHLEAIPEPLTAALSFLLVPLVIIRRNFCSGSTKGTSRLYMYLNKLFCRLYEEPPRNRSLSDRWS